MRETTNDIMQMTAHSAPNIALIKYWGNRNDALRIPAADSLSMTLDRPEVTVSLEPSNTFSVHAFDPNGSDRVLPEAHRTRLQNFHASIDEYMGENSKKWLPKAVSVTIRSAIPPGIGLASSSAIFSALAEAYTGFAFQNNQPVSRRDVSILARLGSGSAARSTHGGYVALRSGTQEAYGSSFAEQIADESHWMLHDIIVAPSLEHKKIGSTEGHAGAATSPLFAPRLAAIPNRMGESMDAIRTRNFEKLQRVAEEDCMNMHAVMQSQTPPLHYLSDATRRIIREIEELRRDEHLEVLYTMDAGPTVHFLCTDSAATRIRDFAHVQKGCMVIEAKVGPGSGLVFSMYDILSFYGSPRSS